MIFIPGKKEKQPEVNIYFKVKEKEVKERRIWRKHSRRSEL
jgi:hypothetical protein